MSRGQKTRRGGKGWTKQGAWEDKKDRGYKQGVRDEVGGGR